MLLRDVPEIPPIYLYDDTGSALFEEITTLPEYYQTRTELGILGRCAAEVVAMARPERIVELGSGAGRKIRLLLNAWRTTGTAGSCTMFDVNACFIDASIRALGADYPEVEFRGVVGDFTRDLARLGAGGDRLVVFFGGTVGNLHPDERVRFFRELAAQMTASDTLLIGVDLVKDRARLEAAYNDSAGVTAAFNRRSLHGLNRRFGADFDPEAFAHRAFYDERNAWIEMRLVATRPMVVKVPALDLRLEFARGDEIRTEVSCKFTRATHSCNVAKPWCRRCPKCAYVWLGCRAHLSRAPVEATFAEDLLEVPENQAFFRDMVGLGEHTPFECIGQVEESRLALALCEARGLLGPAGRALASRLPPLDVRGALERFAGVDADAAHLPGCVADGVLAQMHAAADSCRARVLGLLGG